MIELGMEVETSQGLVGQVVSSPRFGRGWLVRLENGRELRLKDEHLRELSLEDQFLNWD